MTKNEAILLQELLRAKYKNTLLCAIYARKTLSSKLPLGHKEWQVDANYVNSGETIMFLQVDDYSKFLEGI